MKKCFVYCFFVAFLTLGANNFGFSNRIVIKSGIELPVILKQGIGFNFVLPDQYIGTNGDLLIPILVTLEKEGKVISTVVGDQCSNIIFPDVEITNGSYRVCLSVGGFRDVRKFSL